MTIVLKAAEGCGRPRRLSQQYEFMWMSCVVFFQSKKGTNVR